MTVEEQLQVKKYLLEQKLPLDLTVEVYDHFLAQLHDVQASQHITFDEAFSVVKDAWRKDLHRCWRGGFNLEDESNLLISYRKNINHAARQVMLRWFWLLPLTSFLLAYLLDAEGFAWAEVTVLMVPFLYLLFLLIKDFKKFKNKEMHSKYLISYYQTAPTLFFTFSALLIPRLGAILDDPEKYRSLFLFENNAAHSIGLYLAMTIYSSACAFLFWSIPKYLNVYDRSISFIKNAVTA